MKNIILFILFISCFSTFSFSQKKVVKYYNSNRVQTSKGIASYYREIEYDSLGKPMGLVHDYYISGNLQWEGHLLSESPDVFDGKCTWYHEDCQCINEVVYYSNGKAYLRYTYYGNGKIHEIKSYNKVLLTISYFEYDITGKLLVSDKYYNINDLDELKDVRDLSRLNGKSNFYYEYTRFYSNGSIEVSGISNKSKKLFKGISYYPSGEIQQDYLKGNYDRVYDIKGNIIEEYVNDSLIVKPSIDTSTLNDSFDERKYFFRKNINGNLIDYKVVYYGYMNGHYKVTLNNKYGIINIKGEDVLPCIFDRIIEETIYFNTSSKNIYDPSILFNVKINNKWGVKNAKGETIIPCNYDSVDVIKGSQKCFECSSSINNSFFMGLYNVQLGGKWGVVDSQNKVIIPLNYYYPPVIIHSNNIFKVSQQQYYSSLIDLNKTKQNNNTYYLLDFINENLIFFCEKKDSIQKWGAININGDTVIPCMYDNYYQINNTIWVTINNNSSNPYVGAYSLTGEKIIDPIYTFPEFYYVLRCESCSFYENNKIDSVSIIKKDNKFGLFHSSDKLLVPTIYDSIITIPHGYFDREYLNDSIIAIALKDKIWNTIRKNGESSKLNQYDEIVSLRKFDKTILCTYFKVRKNNKYGIIDRNDNIIIPIEYDFIGRGYIENSYIVIKNNKYGIIDGNNSIIIPIEYDFIEKSYIENSYIVRKNNKYGIIDGNNSIIIPIEYDFIGKDILSTLLYCIKDNHIKEIKNLKVEIITDKSLDNRIVYLCLNHIHYYDIKFDNNGKILNRIKPIYSESLCD